MKTKRTKTQNKKPKLFLTGNPEDTASAAQAESMAAAKAAQAESMAVFSQHQTDNERLCTAETFKEFLAVLKDILPYWKLKNARYKWEANSMLNLMLEHIVIRKAASPSILPAVPSSYVGVKDWVADVERALLEKDKEKKQTRLELAKVVMADNKIIDPRTLTNKMNKILKAQGEKLTTEPCIRNHIWPEVRPDK